MAARGDLLDQLDGGNSNSLDGLAQVATAPLGGAVAEDRTIDSTAGCNVSTNNGVVEVNNGVVYENERLESDDDVELDDEPARAPAAAAPLARSPVTIALTSPAAPLTSANDSDTMAPVADRAVAAAPATQTSQISHRTRKKYRLSPTDLEQLEDVFDNSSVISSPQSDDDDATADYRRFCLGTLGALGPLEELSDDDGDDDEEYYYLHDEQYAREADFSVSDVDDDEFDESRDRVSKDELHDLLADKKRVHSTHPREPKAKKQAVVTQPSDQPAAVSSAAGPARVEAAHPEAAPIGMPANIAGTSYSAPQSNTPVVSSAQMASIRQQLRQHVQLCAQVLVVSTQQHGPAVDRCTSWLQQSLTELKYYQDATRAYRYLIQRAIDLFEDPAQGRRPYAWVPTDDDSTTGNSITETGQAPSASTVAASAATGSTVKTAAAVMPEPVLDVALLDQTEDLFGLAHASLDLRRAESQRQHVERRKLFETKLVRVKSLIREVEGADKTLIPNKWNIQIRGGHGKKRGSDWCTAEDKLLHVGLSNYGLDWETIQAGLLKYRTVDQLRARYRSRTARNSKANALQDYKLGRVQALSDDDRRRLHQSYMQVCAQHGHDVVASKFVAQVAKYVLPHKDQSVINDYFDHHLKGTYLQHHQSQRRFEADGADHSAMQAQRPSLSLTDGAATGEAVAVSYDNDDGDDGNDDDFEADNEDLEVDEEDDYDDEGAERMHTDEKAHSGALANETSEHSTSGQGPSWESGSELSSATQQSHSDNSVRKSETTQQEQEEAAAKQLEKDVLKEVFDAANTKGAATAAGAGGGGSERQPEAPQSEAPGAVAPRAASPKLSMPATTSMPCGYGSFANERFEEEVLEDTDSESEVETATTDSAAPATVSGSDANGCASAAAHAGSQACTAAESGCHIHATARTHVGEVPPGSPPARKSSAAFGTVPPTPPPPSPAAPLSKNRPAASDAKPTGPALTPTTGSGEPSSESSGATVSAANEYRDMVPGKIIIFSQGEDLEICEILQNLPSGVGSDFDWAQTARELTAAGKLGPEKDGGMIRRRAEDLQRILFSAGPEDLWVQA